MQLLFERWASQNLDAIPNILTATLIFVAALYLARLCAGVLDRVMQRRRVVSNLANLLSQTLYWTIVVAGLLMALQRFFDVTAFVAASGSLA